MKNTITFLLLTIFSITATGKEIIWKNADDLQKASQLKIITPIIGGGKFLTSSPLTFYVDIFDANFGKPKILQTLSFQFDIPRDGENYLGTIKFDGKNQQKEEIIFLPEDKPYYFHIAYSQIIGSTIYTCHSINEKTFPLEAGKEYVLLADFHRLGPISGVTCSENLLTKEAFEENRSSNKELTGVNNFSRIQLSMLYGSSWVALMAAERVVINHDYENAYAEAAATRLWNNYLTQDTSEIKTLSYMCRVVEETGSSKYKPFLQDLLIKTNAENKSLIKYVKKALDKSIGASSEVFTPSPLKAPEGFDIATLPNEALVEVLKNGTGIELQGAGMQITLDKNPYDNSILDLAADKLEEIHLIPEDSYIAASIWLSRALMKSGDNKYKSLFESMLKERIHKKLAAQLTENLKPKKQS